MAIVWRKDLEIGIEELDKQHKALIEHASDLLEACANGKGKEEVKDTLEFVSEYAVTHLKDEEAYQRKYNYPLYENHARVHKNFLEKVEQLKKQFEEEGPTLHFTIQFNREVVDWFINHISKMDKEFAKYVKENS
ncbi:MAG: hemerythrin family protein [Xylanivirga thermophila]|jgi:hemerythrin|uniref:bacteriohemerythrin n=1 Tax=Xylanivirga thermophila TaxID=2496273 RepID=UPI00101DACF1|nr:hemerythrin family protein [Xylanivirga thermophila]